MDYNIPDQLVTNVDLATNDEALELAVEAIETYCSNVLISLIRAEYPNAVLPTDADINQDGVTTLLELEEVYGILQARKKTETLLSKFNVE
jgi:hypothetical protein